MELILYVLISMSLSSDGRVSLYRPLMYTTEAECDNVRVKLLDFIRSDSVLGATAVCIEVVMSPEEEKEEEKEEKAAANTVLDEGKS